MMVMRSRVKLLHESTPRPLSENFACDISHSTERVCVTLFAQAMEVIAVAVARCWPHRGSRPTPADRRRRRPPSRRLWHATVRGQPSTSFRRTDSRDHNASTAGSCCTSRWRATAFGCWPSCATITLCRPWSRCARVSGFRLHRTVIVVDAQNI